MSSWFPNYVMPMGGSMQVHLTPRERLIAGAIGPIREHSEGLNGGCVIYAFGGSSNHWLFPS